MRDLALLQQKSELGKQSPKLRTLLFNWIMWISVR